MKKNKFIRDTGRDHYYIVKAPKADTNIFEEKTPEQMIECINSSRSSFFKYASDEVKANRDVALALAKVAPEHLRYASAQIRDDTEIMTLAIEKDPYSAYCFASPRLKADRNFALACISKDGTCLRRAPQEFRDDTEIVLEALVENASVLDCASLRFDCDMVRKILSINDDKNNFLELPHEVFVELNRQYKQFALKLLGNKLEKELDSLSDDEFTTFLALVKAKIEAEKSSQIKKPQKQDIEKILENMSK